MRTVTETTVIGRSPEDVFDAAADPQRQLEWDPATLREVHALTPGPVGAGSRYRGRFKGFGTVEYEYAEFDRPALFAHRASIPVGTMLHRFRFEPDDGGTRLTQEGTLTPNLLGRILGPLMAGRLRSRFRQIGAELQTYLAARPAAPSGP